MHQASASQSPAAFLACLLQEEHSHSTSRNICQVASDHKSTRVQAGSDWDLQQHGQQQPGSLVALPAGRETSFAQAADIILASTSVSCCRYRALPCMRTKNLTNTSQKNCGQGQHDKIKSEAPALAPARNAWICWSSYKIWSLCR